MRTAGRLAALAPRWPRSLDERALPHGKSSWLAESKSRGQAPYRSRGWEIGDGCPFCRGRCMLTPTSTACHGGMTERDSGVLSWRVQFWTTLRKPYSCHHITVSCICWFVFQSLALCSLGMPVSTPDLWHMAGHQTVGRELTVCQALCCVSEIPASLNLSCDSVRRNWYIRGTRGQTD